MERLWLGDAVQQRRWELRALGVDVTTSLEVDHYYLQQKRLVYMAMFWEDRDRDDSDGPSSSIE